ncbi:MAG: T9SS type A sorting domain-containing protein [Bacteroidota bacterium]|nr:T9SS type A sorting domain-containing protein [Bacteroidota bacterium]
MKKVIYFFIIPLVVFIVTFAYTALVSTTLDDFFLAGSQPGQSGQLETPDKCDNCHGGYDLKVEPAFTWRGNMMSQAARDPFFYACMTIANQDAAFSGDLCIRCHSGGWLEGRSVPTDGSALNSNDREGVQCDFCHKLVKPAPLGVNPYPNDPAYVSTGTYARDQAYLATLSSIPPTSANGMYIADNSNAKRGPYTDAVARHQVYYSPFHRDAALCGTCHDVSNPAFEKKTDASGNYYYVLNALNAPTPSMDPYTQFPVERTFSEWSRSAYNTPQGVYAPQFGGNKQYVSTCQDCHMRDVTGKGSNKPDSPVRTDLPLHDMTGGNTWVPDILPIFFPGETNSAALAAGKQRAAYMLQKAATMEVSGTIPNISVKIINETGHKLPSGYPEGRRLWIKVKAYDINNNLIGQFGEYDYTTATLNTSNTKVYEVKLGMTAEITNATGLSNLPDGSSFHFVLNNVVVKDNRIPPRGFTNAAFKEIQSPPVAYTYADGQYWDSTPFTLPANTAYYEVNLYYQTVSKDYIEFLRDENSTNDWGTRLFNAWNSTGKSAPVLMATFKSGAPDFDTTPPSTPTNLTATAPKFNTVNLSWNPSTDNVGVAGYYVFRKDKGTTPIATVTTTTYSDGSVKATTTYTYYVQAFDKAGNKSGFSNEATVRTPSRNAKIAVGSQEFKSGIVNLNPNPFNPTTTITYIVSEPSDVVIEVVDAIGRIALAPKNTFRAEGQYSELINTENLSSGIYFFRLMIIPKETSNEPILTTTKGILIK